MVQKEQRIEEIAYLLWEQEGRPDGQSDRFWHAAVAQYEAEIMIAPAGKEKNASLKADKAKAEKAKAGDAAESRPVVKAAARPKAGKDKC